jgi:hypothetical protein
MSMYVCADLAVVDSLSPLGLVAPLSGQARADLHVWEVYASLPPLLFRLGGVHMRRRFVALIDAAGPRLVRLNDYNQMCERCPRTQTDKWNMLANAQIVSTTQYVEIRREWMQERLRDRNKQRHQQLQRKQVIPRCVFCGDILESRRRKYCPAPKHCKSRATYEKTFRSLGLWRGPNRIEQLKKCLLDSLGEPSI